MTDNNIESLSKRSAIEEEATYWVTLQDRRELTPEEQADFETWQSKDPQHREMLDEVRAVWNDYDQLVDLNLYPLPQEPDIDPIDVGDTASSDRSVSQAKVFFAAAAAVIIMVTTAVMFHLFSTPAPIEKGVFQTALGEQQTVTLSDGSTMMLNTSSVVEVDYTQDVRSITLISGEAHFDVMSDKDRPFSVYAGENIVRAIGTAFTVHYDEADVEVTVAEGRVALIRQLNDPSQLSADQTEQTLTEIDAGNNATVSQKEIADIVSLSVPELNRKLAWRRGRIAFAGEPLSDVIHEVSRYTDFKIEIDSPLIGDVPIGGSFQLGDVEELLVVLEDGFGFDVEYISENHVRLTQSS
ncbi:MAG: FecR domain-containing protein [Pseudomonadota bacterium]